MFWCQVVATVIAGTVQLAVQAWLFSNIQGICTKEAESGFTCPSTTVFGTASIIWGVIGPQRQFSAGQMYHGITYFFLVGAIAPIIQYVLHKKLHWNWMKYVNFVSIFLLFIAYASRLTLCSARHLLRHWQPPARDAAQLRSGLYRRLHL